MRAVIWAVALIVASTPPVYAQQGGASTIAVGVVTAERRPVSKSADFVGRVQSINRVEIRARVKGYLEAVLFKEGELVRENAPLYRIEKGLFQAALQQAEGILEASKSKYQLAIKNRERQQDLTKKDVGTQKALDEAIATEGETKGAVLTGEANLTTAQINLGYTEITAPIAGKVGRTSLTKGNVVSPESGILTVIVSQDPMYVTFPVSQRDFTRYDKSGKPVDLKSIKVQIRFSDGSVYDQVGEINFVGVSVDQATDTVSVRATMPNPKDRLIDGQFVQVRLESGEPDEKIVIPQSALIADQQGVYVFVVEDGKAVVKRVKPSGETGPDVVVAEGLSGGEQVIVEGLQAVRPGIAVRASPLPQPLRQG